MGQYLHKYQTIEEFEAAYNNDGSSVVTAITISVSAGTYVFYRQEYGGGFYWKDANNNEAYTETRTPAVGDEAYDITGGWRNVTVASVLSETPEATYIEPWVSLTLEGLPQKVRLWCNGTQHYYGMEYVGPDKTYGDYHKWSSFEIEDRPATDYYYTTTRKLNLGDPVYWSMEGGVDTHEPCAWVESFLEADHRVDYNKITGNYIKIRYDGNGDDDENYTIMEVSDDFAFEHGAPMEGAKYIFVFSDGHTQEMIVGQTYEEYEFVDTPFEGTWIGTEEGPNSIIRKQYNGSHYVGVKFENNTYSIYVVWR